MNILLVVFCGFDNFFNSLYMNIVIQFHVHVFRATISSGAYTTQNTGKDENLHISVNKHDKKMVFPVSQIFCMNNDNSKSMQVMETVNFRLN